MINKYLYLTTAIFLVGCSVNVQPVTEEELAAAAVAELSEMFPQTQAVEGSLDEGAVLERAMINNLDTRLALLETSYARRQLRVDNLEMLPSLTASAGYQQNSDEGYSTSQVLGEAGTTGAYSRGSEDVTRTRDLTLTWNVLDFALGYYNAKQAADRALIAEERQRQAAFDLIRSARGAYWRAVAAQNLGGDVARAISEAEQTLAQITEGQQSGAISNVVALNQKRSVLETIRQLEATLQQLQASQIELARMVNVPPGQRLSLRAASMRVPLISQSLAELENTAFQNSPVLREQNYRSRIAATEVRRVTAGLFPNLSASLSGNYTSDQFRFQDEFTQLGLNVGLNLMQVATAPARRASANEGVAVEEARNLAVRMAVLVQVHLAYQEYNFALQRYSRSRELYEVQRAISEQSDARRQASATSAVENVIATASSISAELRMYDDYARLVAAYETVNATIGQNDTVGEIFARLDEMKRSADEDYTSAETELAALDTERSSLLRQQSGLLRDQAAKVRELERATQLVERLNGRVADEQSIATARANELTEARSAEATAASQLALLSEQINEAAEGEGPSSSSLNAAERDLRVATRELTRATRQLETATAQVSRVQGDLSNAQSSQSVAEAALQEINDQLAQIEARLAQIDASEAEATALRSSAEERRAYYGAL